MKQQIVVVPNRMGVHMRPSGRIVRTAELFTSRITLTASRGNADAKSILQVMMLAMTQGQLVTIEAEGADEDTAIAAIANLFTSGFNEESIY